MKSLLVAAMVVAAAPVGAQECFRGSPEPLSVTSWTAEAADGSFGQGAQMRIVVANRSGVNLRMVQAMVYFHDVLGRSIVSIHLEDDATIPAGGEFVQTGAYRSYSDGGIGRLVAVSPEDIVATICTEAAVTGAGEVIRFHAVPEVPAQMSAADFDALRLEIESCWNIGTIPLEALSVVLTVGFDLTQDAHPIPDSIRMVSAVGGSADSRAAAYEEIRRAILECGRPGYRLPNHLFDQWRHVEMTFSPSAR